MYNILSFFTGDIVVHAPTLLPACKELLRFDAKYFWLYKALNIVPMSNSGKLTMKMRKINNSLHNK